MKQVLLLATTTGYQIRSFSDAAAALGVRLVFASDRCDQLEDPWWDQAIPVRFHDEAASLAAMRASLAAPPDAIVAVGDRPVVLAALAAGEFGLPGNPPPAADASRNKLAARAAFEAAGLPTPRYQALTVDEDPDQRAQRMRYPAVVKPVALSGSRGVMRVDDPAACVAAIARLREILRSSDVVADRDPGHRTILIEEFIPGREFAVEAVLTGGAFQLFAIFDKPDPLDGPFFEETIYVTPSRAPVDVRERIEAAVRRAAEALGLRHGPLHAECRVNERGVYVLEVAARPIGGLCSKALRFVVPSEANGQASSRVEGSLEDVLLRHALGEDVRGWEREPAASGVMMIPVPRRGVLRRVDGVEAARAVAHVSDVRITAKTDALLMPLPEGRSYLGFIFASAAEPETVERALRDAHAQLQFIVEREVPVA